jgi:hypothetical protein
MIRISEIIVLKSQKFELRLKNSVLTSQSTHYVSATKPSRLMLSGETVNVYCKNHRQQRNTRFGRNPGLFNASWAIG